MFEFVKMLHDMGSAEGIVDLVFVLKDFWIRMLGYRSAASLLGIIGTII
jgi:hypothetical protein